MKYKVGEKVLIKGVVEQVDSGQAPYRVDFSGCRLWLNESAVESKAQKVVLTETIAKWLENLKNRQHTLYGVLLTYIEDVNKPNSKIDFDVLLANGYSIQEIIARAYLDGYEIEPDKRYRIPLPGMTDTDGEPLYLTHISNRFIARPLNNTLRQAWKKEHLKYIPEFYRSLAVEVKENE